LDYYYIINSLIADCIVEYWPSFPSDGGTIYTGERVQSHTLPECIATPTLSTSFLRTLVSVTRIMRPHWTGWETAEIGQVGKKLILNRLETAEIGQVGKS
jgi:hypothetical protein